METHSMQVFDKRSTVAANCSDESEAPSYDNFRPTLSGFQPLFDAVLIRELKLENDSLIAKPDAFAEPILYGEVIAVGNSTDAQTISSGDIVRFLANVGTTILFSDADSKERYLTIRAYDVIGKWSA
jgi:co-chaperonin GroES (HSP10)